MYAQAIAESVFDAFYLITVTTLGFIMIHNSRGKKDKIQFLYFGWMAVILGSGDAFHLIPRAYALWTRGLEAFPVALGLGKWITSITMTIFYVLLYFVWRKRYQIHGRQGLTAAVFALAVVRIILCLLPANQWLSANPPLSWGIYRNIPFTILGLIVVVLFYQSAKNLQDKAFRWMWLTIVLSFGFYLPVVLWSQTYPIIGILMIPKTCAYIWTVMIGYLSMRRNQL